MPGSRYWWYRWTDPDGKRHAVSLKTDDEAEAIKLARSIGVESVSQPRQSSITPVLDRYFSEARLRNRKPMRPETARTNRYVLQKYIHDQDLNLLSDISSNSLDRWLADLRKEKYAGETLATYAAMVLTFGRWLYRKHLATYDPFREFERPQRPTKGRSNWIRKDVVQALIDTAPSDDLKFILYAGFHAGLRRGEFSWARVDWFDLENKLVHVANDPENNALLKDENRTVPLTEKFASFLSTYLAKRNGPEYVLEPKKQKGEWKYRFDFRKQFISHVNGKCTIHDMRRSFASNLASAGVSRYKIAQWLGDRVEVVERSYGHLAPGDQDVNKVAA